VGEADAGDEAMSLVVRTRSEEDNWRRVAFTNRLKAEQLALEIELLKDEMEAMQRVIDDLRGLDTESA
jgi:hypothetical protein